MLYLLKGTVEKNNMSLLLLLPKINIQYIQVLSMYEGFLGMFF